MLIAPGELGVVMAPAGIGKSWLLINIGANAVKAGKTYQDFERDMDRDTFMSAEEALAYGLCDKIVTKRV